MLVPCLNWAMVVFTSFIWSYWNTVTIQLYDDNILLLIVIVSVTLLYFIFDHFRTTDLSKGRMMHAFFLVCTLTAFFLFKTIQRPMPIYVLNVGLVSVFKSQVAATSSMIANLLCVLIFVVLLILKDSGEVRYIESNISWPSFVFLTFIHLHFCRVVFYNRRVASPLYSTPLFWALYHIIALLASFWILPKVVTKTLLLGYHDQQSGTFLLILFVEALILVSLNILRRLNVDLARLNIITVTCSTLGIFLAIHSVATNFVFLASIVIFIFIDSRYDGFSIV